MLCDFAASSNAALSYLVEECDFISVVASFLSGGDQPVLARQLSTSWGDDNQGGSSRARGWAIGDRIKPELACHSLRPCYLLALQHAAAMRLLKTLSRSQRNENMSHHSSSSSSRSAAPQVNVATSWACPACTFHNHISVRLCSICQTRVRDLGSTPSAREEPGQRSRSRSRSRCLQQQDDEDDGSVTSEAEQQHLWSLLASVGSPLRRKNARPWHHRIMHQNWKADICFNCCTTRKSFLLLWDKWHGAAGSQSGTHAAAFGRWERSCDTSH